MTPTFAAGLGIVLAGVLALSTARTVIRYPADPPVAGHPCAVRGCAPTSTDGGGEPAAVKPGSKLVTPAPPRATSHGAGPAGAAPAPSGGTGTPPPGPAVHYQTVHQWQGGFLEQVVVSTGPGAAPASWELLLTYPRAQILRVWGGRWVPENDHTALVEPGGHPPEGGGIQVYLVVTGPPGPPSGCSFNGKACHTG